MNDMNEIENSQRKILVIEDDPDFSEYIKATLSDSGYMTESTMDGDDAFDKVKNILPDAITLDILLPGRTGISLYRRFRSDTSTRNIPIIIISGVGTEGKKLALEKFFRGKAVPPPEGVLQKPIDPEELVKTINRVFTRKEHEQNGQNGQINQDASS